MLPAYSDTFLTSFSDTELPSYDFKLDLDSSCIRGIAQNLAELRQAILLMLCTEKRQHVIYPWSYGVQLKDLIGKPMTYVMAKIESRITECLKRDNRISSVTDFEFEQIAKNKLHATFTVNTIFGGVESEVIVDV